MSDLFRIKVCGATDSQSAMVVADAGADALGLNFYPKSRRYVPAESALAIADVVRTRVALAGVFVNAERDHIRDVVDRVGLDWIQLHGDEPPSLISELPDGKVIRAIRWADESIDELMRWEASGAAALLVDAFRTDAYGGTGELVDWQRVGELTDRVGIPVILAGGLTPANVAAAIEVASPWGVDTASGVEASPGQKDAQLTASFVTTARAALASD